MFMTGRDEMFWRVTMTFQCSVNLWRIALPSEYLLLVPTDFRTHRNRVKITTRGWTSFLFYPAEQSTSLSNLEANGFYLLLDVTSLWNLRKVLFPMTLALHCRQVDAWLPQTIPPSPFFWPHPAPGLTLLLHSCHSLHLTPPTHFPAIPKSFSLNSLRT